MDENENIQQPINWPIHPVTQAVFRRWLQENGYKLTIGVDVQAYDAELTQIAGLVDPNADRVLFWDD